MPRKRSAGLRSRQRSERAAASERARRERITDTQEGGAATDPAGPATAKTQPAQTPERDLAAGIFPSRLLANAAVH